VEVIETASFGWVLMFAYLSLYRVGGWRQSGRMPGEDEIRRARGEDTIGSEFG